MKFLLLLSVAFFSLFVRAQDLSVGEDGFPNHWWQPVPANQLPGWEIPPQAADRAKGQVILSKRNELGIFSNLGAAEFTLDGDTYASVEALWQGMKYPENADDARLQNPRVTWKLTRQQVMRLSGFESKAAGAEANSNMKKLGIKWITYQGRQIFWTGVDKDAHYQIILAACRAKLAQNPDLTALLLSTKNLVLMPDHNESPGSSPAFFYADIYTKLRAELTNGN